MDKYKKHLIYISILLIVLQSCSNENIELESALQYSGNNRIELEQVLNFYKNIRPDSLKLKAAKYLITNMPKHFSYNEASNQYYKDVNSILNTETNKDSIIKKIEQSSKTCEKKIHAVEDIKHIKSEYLIENIENSFALWKEPWAKHLDFKEFCEYLLPYKISDYQNITYWKDSLISICNDNLNQISLCQDYKYSAVAAASIVNDNLKGLKKGKAITEMNALPIYDPQLLMKLPIGSCYDYCFLAAIIMRSKGIPVAIDFTPQWPDRKSGHSWNVVLSSNRGKNVSFVGTMNNPGADFFSDSKMAKVFRHTFAANKELVDINLYPSNVPNVFRNIFIKDVTEEYIKTIDISVPTNSNDKYVYLCVFDNNEWRAVAWGQVKNRMAYFKKIGKNIVYLPVSYSNNKMSPVGSAFLLDEQGKIKPIAYDKSQKESVTIKRKFPLLKHVYAIKWRLQNGLIQAANRSDFKDLVTIAQFPEWELTSGSVEIDTDKQYRYFRFMSSTSWYCDMAELFFYEKGSLIPIKSIDSFTHDNSNKISHLANNSLEDRNLLTYFSAYKDSVWIGLDFGKSVRLSKISYIRRGDGNAICPKDTYELYFWDNKKWTLVGKQEATDIKLEFDNVPKNSLLYIRNSSSGLDNRIFFNQSGEIVWY